MIDIRETVRDTLKRFPKTMRLLASGMEARRAAAENTDAVHDSPTAAPGGGDAHTSAVKKGR